MILVIDDDRAIRSTLVYILERNGYETQNTDGLTRFYIQFPYSCRTTAPQ